MQDLTDEQLRRMSLYLTTEHFTLQGARGGTIAEANGRVGHYLSIVGSGIVALAFVANVSSLGPIFLVFSGVLFPLLIVLGIATLVRTLQIGIADSQYAQAINRIRHFYLEVAPDAQPYFSFSQHDDPEATLQTMMPFHSRFQGLASTPGPVLLVNSVLCGTFGAIIAAGWAHVALTLTIVIGAAVLALAIGLHWFFATRIWRRVTSENVEIRFPTPGR